MKRFIVMLIMLSMGTMFSGCARPPKKIKSCTIKISTEIKDNRESYIGMLKIKVVNENSDTIFNNVKGRIIIAEEEVGEITIPFTYNKLLPFDNEIVVFHTLTDADIKTLMPIMDLSVEHFYNKGRIDVQSISEDKVTIEIDSFSKENINDALRGKK